MPSAIKQQLPKEKSKTEHNRKINSAKKSAFFSHSKSILQLFSHQFMVLNKQEDEDVSVRNDVWN